MHKQNKTKNDCFFFTWAYLGMSFSLGLGLGFLLCFNETLMSRYHLVYNAMLLLSSSTCCVNSVILFSFQINSLQNRTFKLLTKFFRFQYWCLPTLKKMNLHQLPIDWLFFFFFLHNDADYFCFPALSLCKMWNSIRLNSQSKFRIWNECDQLMEKKWRWWEG